MLFALRITGGILLGFISLLCIRHNGHIKWDVWVRKVDTAADKYEKGETVPFIGGVTGFFAVLCFTGGHKIWLALLPAVLDYGTIPMLLYALWEILRYCIRNMKKYW